MIINGFIHTNVTKIESCGDPYFVTVTDPCFETVGSLFDEMVLAASSLPEPLYLAMSGGVDSECIASVLLAANKDFTSVIMRYTNGDTIYNEHDYSDAVLFCIKNNISYRFFDLDFNLFYKSNEYLSIGTEYGCESPQLTAHIKLASQFNDRTIIFGGNIGVLIDGLYDFGNYKYHYLDRYAAISERPVIANLFNINKRTLKASIKARQALSGSLNLDPTNYMHKIKTLQNAGFNVNPRDNKYTGFELIKKFYKYETNFTKHAYDKLFRNVLERYVPRTDTSIIKLHSSYFS